MSTSDSPNDESPHGTIAVCKQETDFHEDTSFSLTKDGLVRVRSTGVNGLISQKEWEALRQSPWEVFYSDEAGLVLIRDDG